MTNNNPYTISQKIIDGIQNKPYELIHQRFFNNIDISTGWKDSVDGLFYFTLDVEIEVPEGESEITLAYSPHVTIPSNFDRTCQPHNFPMSKTIGKNMVRIYAYKIPDPVNMLPVTIEFKQVNTNFGTTNGGYSSQGSDIKIEDTFLQVKGTSFIIDIDDNNDVKRETEVKMFISAYKGEAIQDVNIKNLITEEHLIEFNANEPFKNMDGSKIDLIDNEIEVRTLNRSTEDDHSAVFWATIPKGLKIKDKLAYFVVPVDVGGRVFYARSTVYTNKSNDIITDVSRYKVSFPVFSRSTGGNYFVNGEPFQPTKPPEVKIEKISVNGVSTNANGLLRVHGVKRSSVEELSPSPLFQSSSTVPKINDPSVFDGWSDLRVEFLVAGEVKFQTYTGIDIESKDLTIRTDMEYIVPATSGSSHIVPGFSASVYSIIVGGFLERYYGDIRVTDSFRNEIALSDAANYKISIPTKTYEEGALPLYYLIDVIDPTNNQSKVSKMVSILKTGDAATPYSLEVSPPSVIVEIDKNGAMIHSSQNIVAQVMRGSEFQDDWIYTNTYNSQANDLVIEKSSEPDSGNKFNILNFGGPSISAVITITATKGSQSFSRDIVVTKIRDVSEIGSYTFIKYGEMVEGEEGEVKTFKFTVDPSGLLEPGERVGPYYGIAVSNLPEAPSSESSYKWIVAGENAPKKGEQGEPGTSFYIDGINLIKVHPNPDGELDPVPNNLNLTVKSIRGDAAVSVDWQYLDSIDFQWKSFPSDNGSTSLVTPIKTNMFIVDQMLQVRVEIGAFEKDEIVSTYAHLNIYMLYTNSSEYFAQITAENSDNKYSHVFPIDGYGNPIDGVSYLDRPVIITANAFRGLETLVYEEDMNAYEDAKGLYFLENIKTKNCSVSAEKSNGKLIGHFDSISGSSGSVTFVVSLEREETLELTFNWSTDQIANIGDRRVAVTPNRSHFTVNTATYGHILDWPTFSHLYKSKFKNENDNIDLYFSFKNTNIKSISIGSEGLGYSPLNGILNYTDGDKTDLVPLNLFDKNYISLYSNEDLLEAEVVPGEYYLVFTTSKISEWTFSFKNAALGAPESFNVLKGFVFDGDQEATIIQAPAGAESLVVTEQSNSSSKIIAFHLQKTNEINRVLNDDFDLLAPEKEGANEVPLNERVMQNNHLQIEKLKAGLNDDLSVLPLSYTTKIGDFYSYKYDEESNMNYLSLDPVLATDINYFDGGSADAESQIKVQSITGEETYLTIYRNVRPYGSFNDKLSELVSGDHIYKQDLLPLQQSRESIRLSSQEIVDSVEKNQKITIESEAPEIGQHEMFYSELEDGTVPISAATEPEADSVVFDGVNAKSIFGVNMYDYAHHLLEFEVKYIPKNISEHGIIGSYSFENMTLKDRGILSSFTDAKTLTPNEWVKHSYLIPAARSDKTKEQITINDLDSYFEQYNIDQTNIKLVYSDRVENRNQYAAYYMYFQSSSLDGDEIFIRKVKVMELRPSQIEDNKIYQKIKNLDQFSAMERDSKDYVDEIDRLEGVFKAGTDKVLVTEFPDIYKKFEKAQLSIKEMNYQIAIITHSGYENATFKVRSDSRSYALGFSNSTGWLSSLRITPNGVVVQGEKNQIIGSTSIGALYGKKIVIGKEMTSEDIAHDKVYDKGTEGKQGYFAVWDENKWASTINKDGQYFYRYDDRGGTLGLVGYMVMNPHEIAAYQFDKVTSGFQGTTPLDLEKSVLTTNKYAAFKIDRTGEVLINKLSVRSTATSARASVDLMDTVRVTDYSSEDLGITRKGIVFIGIKGGSN